MNRNDSIRWGIVGAGGMAGSFVQALQTVEDAVPVAVASRSAPGALAFSEKFDIPRHYGCYRELLAEASVDVVYVATPHSSHSEICIACLEMGKAVLCEKPFAINAPQARTVIELAREKQLFLMEAMWTRFLPAVEKLRELLHQKRIGDVQILLAGGAYMPDPDPEYYLFNKALGGGILLDAGVYLVSMASMVFGKPEQVLATGQLGSTGVDEHEAILLSHQHGEIASLYVSHRASSAPDLTLLGNKGKIYLHPPIFCPTGLTLAVDGMPEDFFDFSAPDSGYQHQVREVNRCLREGRKESSLMALDETLAIMETMDEIRRQVGMHYPADL